MVSKICYTFGVVVGRGSFIRSYREKVHNIALENKKVYIVYVYSISL